MYEPKLRLDSKRIRAATVLATTAAPIQNQRKSTSASHFGLDDSHGGFASVCAVLTRRCMPILFTTIIKSSTRCRTSSCHTAACTNSSTRRVIREA